MILSDLLQVRNGEAGQLGTRSCDRPVSCLDYLLSKIDFHLEKIVGEVMVLFPQTFFDTQIDILCFLANFLIFRVHRLHQKHSGTLRSLTDVACPLVQSASRFVFQHFQRIVSRHFKVYREEPFNLFKVQELMTKLLVGGSGREQNDLVLVCFLNEFRRHFVYYDFRFPVLSISQQIALGKFSQTVACDFADFVCKNLHFQSKFIDFPELYTLFNLAQFKLARGLSLEHMFISQNKNRSETLNLDLLKGVFKVLVVTATWKLASLSSAQFEALLQAILHLLKFHFTLLSEENLLLLICFFEKLPQNETFLKMTIFQLNELLSKLSVSRKNFPVFTVGIKLLLLHDQPQKIFSKGYFKCFKDFLYTTSEHVKKGHGEKLFYQNTLLRQAFELAQLVNSRPALKKMFDLSTHAKNFIYSLMDDEQVLKRDIIRLLDEDRLIIEFNCRWDFCSDFLSHLRKLCDYSLAQDCHSSREATRFSLDPLQTASGPPSSFLLGYVTSFNLFELDTHFQMNFKAQTQRLTSLNELIQMDSRVFCYPTKNVLLVEITIQNITKILVKHVGLSISGKLHIYPESIVIGSRLSRLSSRGFFSTANQAVLDPREGGPA